MSSIVDQVHELEDEFGGIANIPFDETRLIKLQKRLKKGGHSSNGKKPEKPVDMEILKVLWEHGLSDREIAQTMNNRLALIRIYRSRLGLVNVKAWILTKGNERLVFKNNAALSDFLGLASRQSGPFLIKKAEEHGWVVSKEMSHEY